MKEKLDLVIKNLEVLLSQMMDLNNRKSNFSNVMYPILVGLIASILLGGLDPYLFLIVFFSFSFLYITANRWVNFSSLEEQIRLLESSIQMLNLVRANLPSKLSDSTKAAIICLQKKNYDFIQEKSKRERKRILHEINRECKNLMEAYSPYKI